MSTTLAQQLTYTSVLSQDFVTSSGVVVDTARPGQVGVFRNPTKNGAIEALVISDQAGQANQIFYLAQTAGSLTGWTLTPLVDGGGQPKFATEIITVGTTWGAVDAFYIGTGGHLTHTWLDATQPCGWVAPTVITGAPSSLSQLRVAFSPGATTSSGSLMVYAIDPTGTVFLYWSTIGAWSAATMPLGGKASSWTLALTDQSSWFLSMVASDGFSFRPGGSAHDPIGFVQQGWVAWANGTMSGSGLGISGGGIDSGHHQVNQVLFNATNMEGTTSTMIVMLAGAKDGAGGHPASWLIEPGTTGQAYGTIAGTSFVDAAVVESSDGFVNLYAVDPLMNLFVVRQVTFAASDMSTGYGTTQTWGPVFQLDTEVARIYADPTPSDAPALMAADGELGALSLYYQDPTTSLWLTLPITLPSTTKLEINRWRTEVQVYDADGQPLAGASVAVTAASAVDLEINGQYVVIDSVQAATIVTNGFGTATFASLATSLTPPALTLTAAGAPATSVSPGRPVNDYLAGTGSLMGKPTFDVTAVSALAGPNSKVDPGTALDAIQKCATLGQAGAGQAKARASMAAHRAGGTPVHVYTKAGGHRAFATRAAADTFMASATAGASFWSDVWDDVTGFAGDVWHAINEGLHAVESIVIDFGAKAVQLWITVEGALVQLADWIVNTVEDALHAITSVFNWIEAEVGKVIDFLKMLFDFQAIWNTKTFMVGQLTALPTFLASQFTTWSNQLQQGFFAKNKALIDGYFDGLITRYTGQQFTQLPGWVPTNQPASTATPQLGSATPSDLGNNVSGNWLQDKVVSNGPASFGTIPTSANTPLDNFLQAMVDAGQDLFNAFLAFGQGFRALLNVSSLASFENVAISTFLTIAKDLVDTVIDLADALVQGLLALGQLAMDGFTAVMTMPLQLGFINDVYAWVAGKVGGDPTMTMGDLLCLLLAFPTTIVWKLIAGVDTEPFPNGQAPGQLLAKDASAATIAQVFGTCAGVLTVVGGLWGFAGDAMEAPPTWFQYVGYGITGLHLVFTHPGFLDWATLEWTTTAIIAANLLWLGPVLYWTLGTAISTVLSDTSSEILGWLKAKGLTWEASDLTKLASSFVGLLLLGATVYGVAMGNSPPILATAQIINGIASPFAFLTMTPVIATPVIGEIAEPLKLVLDLATSLGGGVLEVVSAWQE